MKQKLALGCIVLIWQCKLHEFLYINIWVWHPTMLVTEQHYISNVGHDRNVPTALRYECLCWSVWMWWNELSLITVEKCSVKCALYSRNVCCPEHNSVQRVFSPPCNIEWYTIHHPSLRHRSISVTEVIFCLFICSYVQLHV